MLTIDEQTLSKQEPKDGALFDPHLSHVEMPFRAVYYPLGFSLELTTNSEEVMGAAEESWGTFRQLFDFPTMQLRVGVLDGESTECPPGPIFRAHRNLLVGIADQANFCINDIGNGSSFAWLTSAAVSRRSYLRYHYLEAAALSHIANRYTAPIHAACVELDGHGVLLCGESGAGKSSLAFACARAGWTYITDDASFLLNGNGRRVVGNCHLMRLRPSAAELFAEAADKPLTPRAGGKPSIELFTDAFPRIATAGSANVSYVVFLNRQDVPENALTPFPKASARTFMQQRLHGLDDLHTAQLASVERLLAVDVLELRYRDLDWAVNRLERLVRGQH